MWSLSERNRGIRLAALLVLLGSLALLTGCQVDVGGQTLPSPYYIYDDVQYFPAGPEFKLSEEARAMRELEGADVDLAP